MVDDAALEALQFDVRKPLQRLFARQKLRRPEPELAGEHVVELHADAVKGTVPPFVNRNDEGEVVRDVGRVLQEPAPLLQRLHDQRDVALLKVADAPMHELRRPA